MTAPLAWSLLAVAVIAAPARVAPRPPAAGAVSDRRTRAGLAAVVLSVTVACVVAAGPRIGLPVAAGCGPLAAFLVRRAQRRSVGAQPDGTLALVLDLTAAALRTGRPLADALALAAPAGRPELTDVLDRVARLSRLGADAEHAWSSVPRDGPLGEVARVAVRSSASGLKLAAGLERLAGEIRARRAIAATVRAHRAGVVAMAPLAACFLPSFVCLGVVPVVAGVARNALAVLP